MTVNISEEEYLERCCHRFPILTTTRERDDETTSASCLPIMDGRVCSAEFRLIKVIGGGTGGTVILAERLRRGLGRPEAQLVAVKVIELEGKSLEERKRSCNEIECLSRCSCFSILRDHCDMRYPPTAIDDCAAKTLAIVMDYAKCGDLRREVKSRQKSGMGFAEHEIVLMFLQLVMAVKYLHSHGIVHRDIKTANILLCEDGLLKLCDFGLSRTFEQSSINSEEQMYSLEHVVFCGTPFYMAPEVWNRNPYGTKADMYSLGIVLYEMMFLRRPYEREDDASELDLVAQSLTSASATIDLDRSEMQHVSPELMSILRWLLQSDPRKRVDCDDLLQLPLMRLYCSALLEMAHDPSTDISAADRDRLIRGIRRLSFTARRENNANANLKLPSSPDSQSAKMSRGGSRRDNSSVTFSKTTHSTSMSRWTRSFTNAPSSDHLQSDSSNAGSPVGGVESGRSSSSAAGRPDVVVREGPVFKEGAAAGQWKSRYLCLGWVEKSVCQYGSPTSAVEDGSDAIEMVLCITRDAKDVRFAQKRIADFLDVFPLHINSSNGCDGGGTYAFALVLFDGKKMVFSCSTREERDLWVSELVTALQQTG